MTCKLPRPIIWSGVSVSAEVCGTGGRETLKIIIPYYKITPNTHPDRLYLILKKP